VATTDRVFTAVTSPSRLARTIRIRIVPRLFPALTRSASFRRLMFRTISQTAFHYRASPLSAGRAGRVRGGDRLPWVPSSGEQSVGTPGSSDNFEPLLSLDWQAHTYGGEPPPALVEACRALGLALHAFPWTPAARRAGLRRAALYLVRPDGYVALADPDADPTKLERYLESRGLRPLNTSETRAIPGQSRS